MLGGLTVLADTAYPSSRARLRRRSASARGPTRSRSASSPSTQSSSATPAYRRAVAASFIATSAGFVGLAAEGVRGSRASR